MANGLEIGSRRAAKLVASKTETKFTTLTRCLFESVANHRSADDLFLCKLNSLRLLLLPLLPFNHRNLNDATVQFEFSITGRN